jgi:hypothetical protein
MFDELKQIILEKLTLTPITLFELGSKGLYEIYQKAIGLIFSINMIFCLLATMPSKYTKIHGQ